MLNVPRDLTLFELGEAQHRNVSAKPAAKQPAPKPAAKQPRRAIASPYDKVRRRHRLPSGPSGPSLQLQDGPSGPLFQDGPSGPLFQDGPSGPMFQDGPSGPMYGGGH